MLKIKHYNHRKILLIACLVLNLLTTACNTDNKPDANKLLPSFNAITLDNQNINSNNWKDKVVILNFWATSCGACIAEMPQLSKFYTKFKDKGLNMLAVSMPYDAPSYVMNFAKSKNLSFPIAMDLNSDITNQFADINLTPTTFVYVKGKRVQKIIGEPDWDKLEELVQASL